jgi:polyhydroxybutyrate depolymerase
VIAIIATSYPREHCPIQATADLTSEVHRAKLRERSAGATVAVMGRSILLAGGLVMLVACGGGAAGPLPVELGGDRPVKLQVPPTVEEGKLYPLVLILHGYGVDGFVQQSVLRMRDLSERYGAFVMAPDGTADSTGRGFWNADPACCDLDHTGVDDVAYLGGLIDTVIAQRPIDPARVYVIGHSNGAWMAYRLACDRADVVTAIAGLAGAAPSIRTSCAPSRPVALLHMHGTADDTVLYAGEDRGDIKQPGAVASVAQWAAYDGCTGALVNGARLDLEPTLAGAETQTASTAGCPAGAAADLWTIEGGAHLPDIGPSFPSEVWAWLDAHPRP